MRLFLLVMHRGYCGGLGPCIVNDLWVLRFNLIRDEIRFDDNRIICVQKVSLLLKLLFLTFFVIFNWIFGNGQLALNNFAIYEVRLVVDQLPGIHKLVELHESKAPWFCNVKKILVKINLKINTLYRRYNSLRSESIYPIIISSRLIDKLILAEIHNLRKLGLTLVLVLHHLTD